MFRKSSLDFRCQTVWFRAPSSPAPFGSVPHWRPNPATLTTKNDRNEYTRVSVICIMPLVRGTQRQLVNIYIPSALCVARHTQFYGKTISAFLFDCCRRASGGSQAKNKANISGIYFWLIRERKRSHRAIKSRIFMAIWRSALCWPVQQNFDELLLSYNNNFLADARAHTKWVQIRF